MGGALVSFQAGGIYTANEAVCAKRIGRNDGRIGCRAVVRSGSATDSRAALRIGYKPIARPKIITLRYCVLIIKIILFFVAI